MVCCPRPLPEPGQILSTADAFWLLRRYLHPMWWSVGVESNRWGERPRKAQNIAPAGTIWTCTFDGDREWADCPAIPCEAITYLQRTAKTEFDDTGRVVGEAQAVGWYTTLRQLVQLGILRNHPDLDRALGWQHRDGKAATPRDAHARACTAELIPAKWWVPEGVGLR